MKDLFGLNISNLLVLIGLAAVSALAYVVNQNIKIGNTVSDINFLVSNIQQAYNTTGNYATLTNTVVLNGKDTAPAEMIVGGVLQNQWGNAITVTPGTVLAGYTAQQIGVDTGILPQGACVKVLSSMKVAAAKVGTAATQVAPLDPAQIATNCAAGAGAASITMIF